MTTYYNEFDKNAAAWIRNLGEAGEIEKGVVDERSIKEVSGADLEGTTRAHFFAGIGGWELALRLAGWGSEEVWTGSCPCQPFSVAGKRKGIEDSRHLWPDFLRLISERRPATVFGEQVAGKDGREWLTGVRSDLEALGYAVGAADLCAAGVGAPHIRQRLYWVAHAVGKQKQPVGGPSEPGRLPMGRDTKAIPKRETGHDSTCRRGENFGLADSTSTRRQTGAWERGLQVTSTRKTEPLRVPGNNSIPSRVEHSSGIGRIERGAESGWWGSKFRCGADGKQRRLEPGTEPLADGISKRVDKLRGYGNAIVPPLAAEFIMAFREAAGI